MRIISQKGMPVIIDLPYERIGVSQSYEDPNYIIVFDTAASDDDYFYLARYSTPEKAEKAMQKLHEAYAPEPLFIHKDVSPYERAAAGEMSWTQALNEVNTNLIVRPIQNSSIEQVYTGNIVFRFPQEDEI